MKYNFREDFFHFGYPPAQMLLAGIKQKIGRSPLLKEEFESGEYSGYYRPKNILVLVSPYTFSSGYTMMRKLKLAGAVLVGSPSAQAHSKASFGNGSYFKLKNSGIPIYISRECYNTSHIFQPDYTLTYEKLASFRFDMNAEILFALEIVKKM